MGESRGENFFFQSIPALDKGESRKTNDFVLLHFLSAGERLSWQSKEDKSAHGTRVNESKRARLPNPKAPQPPWPIE